MGDDKDIVKQVPMPVGEIVIYPITSDELDQLEAGGPSSTIFGITLTLIGLGVGGLISILLAGPAPKDPTLRYMITIVLVAVTLVVGAVLGLVWLKLPNPMKTIIGKVRRREMPPPAPAPMPNSTTPLTLPATVPVQAPMVQVNVVEVEKKP